MRTQPRLPINRQNRLSLVLIALWFFTSVPVKGGERTDIIYLKNGDKITGEIRLVQDGVLQLKCDYGSGRFNIYWDQVEKIITDKILVAELASGERVRGPVVTKPSGEMTITDKTGHKVDFSLPEVAWMHEGTEGFWGHFDGNLAVGYTLTKSNTTQQVTANGTILYNSEEYIGRASLETLFNSQKSTEPTHRIEGTALLRRMMGEKWFSFGGFDALHSTELELSLRTTLGGGAGRYIRRNFRHVFALGGGVAWNREIYFNPSIPNQNSPEAIFAVQYDFFNVLGHNVNLINQISTFKSLSRGSRTRLDLNTSLQWFLPAHFYFNVAFSDNFDSSPVGNTPKNDFVFSTGFGWSP